MRYFLHCIVLCALAVLVGGCQRPILKPVEIGTYSSQPALFDGSPQFQPGQLISCDDAISFLMRLPSLDGLNRATNAMSRILGERYAPFGEAELRYRHNLSQRNEFRTSVRWRPPLHSQTRILQSLQQASKQAAAAQDRMRRALLNGQVRILHVEYRLAELAQRRTKIDLETYQVQLALGVEALKAGTITRADFRDARLNVKRAQLAYSDATHELSLAIGRFVSLTNAKPKAGRCTLNVVDAPLSDHPEVRLAIETAKQQRARADREAVEAGFWPAYLQTSWQRSDNAANDQFLVELGIPLLGGNDQQAAVALGEARILDARAQWVAVQIASEVKMARAAVKSRQAQVDSAREYLDQEAGGALGTPMEKERFKRLENRLELDVERLELLVERAQIQLKIALGQP